MNKENVGMIISGNLQNLLSILVTRIFKTKNAGNSCCSIELRGLYRYIVIRARNNTYPNTFSNSDNMDFSFLKRVFILIIINL